MGLRLTEFPESLMIFGCGNMGGAMLRGWITGGVEPQRFTVIDPVVEGLPDGVTLLRNAAGASALFDTALLGIKPQMLSELRCTIAPLLAPKARLLSVLAGTTIETLSSHFPDAQIIRVMPNLAAAIGKSPVGLWSENTGNDFRAALNALFAPLGQPLWLDSEAQMDAVTALVGSGPAFVYRFIDALSESGKAIGLSPALSESLALTMVEGATQLAAQAEDSPGTLAQRVASPGGTTAAGLAVLDENAALALLVEKTLRAARDRGAEIAKGS